MGKSLAFLTIAGGLVFPALGQDFNDLCGPNDKDSRCTVDKTVDVTDASILDLARFLATDEKAADAVLNHSGQLTAAIAISSKCGTSTWKLVSILPAEGDELTVTTSMLERSTVSLEYSVLGTPKSENVAEKGFEVGLESGETRAPEEVRSLLSAALSKREDVRDFLAGQDGQKLGTIRVESMSPKETSACGGLYVDRVTFFPHRTLDEPVRKGDISDALVLRRIDGPGGIVRRAYRSEAYVSDHIQRLPTPTRPTVPRTEIASTLSPSPPRAAPSSSPAPSGGGCAASAPSMLLFFVPLILGNVRARRRARP